MKNCVKEEKLLLLCFCAEIIIKICLFVIIQTAYLSLQFSDPLLAHLAQSVKVNFWDDPPSWFACLQGFA